MKDKTKIFATIIISLFVYSLLAVTFILVLPGQAEPQSDGIRDAFFSVQGYYDTNEELPDEIIINNHIYQKTNRKAVIK